MKFIIASMAVMAISAIKLESQWELSDLDIGHKHPLERFADNKIDNIFPEHFNTIPRGDSEWQSSGPEAFKVPAAVPETDNAGLKIGAV